VKFQYAYRDHSNARCDGVIDAPSRDAVFKKLRAQGVKPFFVAPAPGFFNRIRGIGKRGVAILVLALLVATLSVVLLRSRDRQTPIEGRSAREVFDTAVNSHTRRQPIGDVATIDSGIRSGWAGAFELEGERFLASFAIPGVRAGKRSASEDEVRAALENKREAHPDDSLEVRQVVAMVEGMKDELRRFLRDGGTIAEYGAELVARQEAEMSYRQRAQHHVEELIKAEKPEEEISGTLADYNQQLRRMGIRPITISFDTPLTVK